MQVELEELKDMWESSVEDIHISTEGPLGSGDIVASYCGREIARASTTQELAQEIHDWQNRQSYWPNIWEVNDHGNVELMVIEHAEDPDKITLTSIGGLV